MSAPPRLRVVLLGHADARGGAARATQRLHHAFQAHGLDSLHLVFRRLTNDPETLQIGLDPDTARPDLQRTCRTVQQRLYREARSALSDTYVSFPYPGFDLTRHPALRWADIIHLNWPGPQVSPLTVSEIARLGVPLVWTLHDESAYTGGCHYTAGCQGFERRCRRCPQLNGAARDLPALVLEDKRRLWRACPLQLVAPSRWLARRAEASRLFGQRPIHHIPNPLPPAPFVARPMEHCRARLGLPADAPLVLCVALNLGERRKGFALLAEAMGRLQTTGRRAIEPILVTVGRHAATAAAPRSLHLGPIDDDFELATVYAAVDVVAVPSLEDNFPSAALEALGCGVPVVGFRRGGLPELVDRRSRGLLAEEVDAQALADRVAEVLRARSGFAQRKSLAESVHTQFSTAVAAGAYAARFRALAARRRYPLLRRRRAALCPQLDRLGPATADIARILVAAGLDPDGE